MANDNKSDDDSGAPRDPSTRIKISFSDLEKKFSSQPTAETNAGNTSPSSPAVDELDSSHYEFDSSTPHSILIAGAGGDGCGTDGGGSCGDSGCDSGDAGSSK